MTSTHVTAPLAVAQGRASPARSDHEKEKDAHGESVSSRGSDDEPRRAFMADYISRLNQDLLYAVTRTSTPVGPRFSSLFVRVPQTATPEGDASRRTLLYATELVACMLQLDPATWSYLRVPSWFDELDFVPKMTFALNAMLTPEDEDDLDAVQ